MPSPSVSPSLYRRRPLAKASPPSSTAAAAVSKTNLKSFARTQHTQPRLPLSGFFNQPRFKYAVAACAGLSAVYWAMTSSSPSSLGGLKKPAGADLSSWSRSFGPPHSFTGRLIYDNRSRPFVPEHPRRHYDESGKALIAEAYETSLTENQYSLRTHSPLLARLDQTSVASNDPIEDRHSEHHFRLKHPEDGSDQDVLLFGMYDGHSGWECAETLRYMLPHYAVQELLRSRSRIDNKDHVERALTQAFERLDEDLRTVAQDPQFHAEPQAIAPALSGAVTLLTCLMGDHVYVASAGDVRAVIGRRKEGSSRTTWETLEMSHDHDADNEKERERLLAEHPGEENDVLKRKRVLGGLQPTRAFGDSSYKWTQQECYSLKDKLKQGAQAAYAPRVRPPANSKTPPYVTAKPDVLHHQLDDQDLFMVVATDGIWERLESEQVVDFMGKYMDRMNSSSSSEMKLNAAAALVDHALVAPYEKEKHAAVRDQIMAVPAPYSRNIRDDITVTVLFFKDCPPGSEGKETLPVLVHFDERSWAEVLKEGGVSTKAKL